MKEHFIDQYRAFAANGASGAPEWLRAVREQAIAQLDQIG